MHIWILYIWIYINLSMVWNICVCICIYVYIYEVKNVLVAQSCRTLYNLMDFSLPGSSVHGISQARILEKVAFPFSKGSSWLRVWTRVSCIAGRFFTIWATREAPQTYILFHIPCHLKWWPKTEKFLYTGIS